MMKNMTWKEALLPQPPSFNKKRNYEMKELLGEGAFGKVVVSVLQAPMAVPRQGRSNSTKKPTYVSSLSNRMRHGMSLQTKSPSLSGGLLPGSTHHPRRHQRTFRCLQHPPNLPDLPPLQPILGTQE